MEILYLLAAFILGGFMLYIGVRIGFKLSKGQDPTIEPIKAVSNAVKAVASTIPKEKKEDPWEEGMRNMLSYDGIKNK